MDIFFGDGYVHPAPFTPQPSSSPTPSVPQSLHNARIVIIGGGPAGLFTAIALRSLNLSNVTVLERHHATPSVPNPRSYVFGLSPRGQAALSRVPGLLEYMRRNSAAPDGYKTCIIPSGELTAQVHDPSMRLTGFKPGILFLRDRFVCALKEFLVTIDKDEMMEIIDDSIVESVDFLNDEAKIRYRKNNNTEMIEINADLVFACDGANSLVVDALQKGHDESTVVSANGKGFRKTLLSSFAVGRCAKSIILDNEILRHIANMPKDFESSHWTSIQGVRFGMTILPVLPMDRVSHGGLMATISRAADDVPWTIPDVSSGYRMFEDNFPNLNVRERISHDAMRAFVYGRHTQFKHIAYVHSLGGLWEHNEHGGVLIMGDAAHQVPPDMGQGLNSSLEDVAIFYDLICSTTTTKTTTSMKEVIRMYDDRRIADVRGLAELCTFAGMTQNENDMFDVWRRKIDRFLRMTAAKYYPKWFYPPVFAMLSYGWPYAVIRRRHFVTTVRLAVVCTLSFVVCVAAIIGMVVTVCQVACSI